MRTCLGVRAGLRIAPPENLRALMRARTSAAFGVALTCLAMLAVACSRPNSPAPLPSPPQLAGPVNKSPQDQRSVPPKVLTPSRGSLVATFGTRFYGSPPPGSPVITGIAASGSGPGYYVLRADGEVEGFGVSSRGSLSRPLPSGVTATGIAVDPSTGGYWVLASDGSVYAFDAPFYGDPRFPSGGWGQYPAAVAIAAAPSGRGYYVLRANGAIDNFGVPSLGSLGGRLHYGATAPVTATGLAIDPSSGGYWETTSVGTVSAFHAPWLGSPLTSAGGRFLGSPTVGIAAAAGGGYYVLQADGAVESFSAPQRGSLLGHLALGATAAGIAADPATGGYLVAVAFSTEGGYLDPLRGLTSLVPQEIDQGVDYCGFGPLYPIGPGVVVNTVSSGWPGGGFIAYRLSAGPARGLIVYDAENVTPTVKVGEVVTASTVLGFLHDAGTCLETGWANPTPPDQAAGRFEYTGSNSTAFGLNFSALLQQLGARPGLPQGGPPGPLPTGWPSW